MPRDLFLVLAGTCGLIGFLLVVTGLMTVQGAMYAFKSKEDGHSLAERHCATRRLVERQKISAEAWSHLGEAWKTTPGRWLILVGIGMFVGAYVCEGCLQ